MDISSLLNTDLGNLKKSTLILKNDCLSMYITTKFLHLFKVDKPLVKKRKNIP